jgi:two-component system, OmpR family, phosphate regulon response regulator OmpR
MSTNKGKLLVIDDDLRLRELLKRYLSEQGFSVAVVPDAEAMNRARARERYDLLVLDLMLPGEDGLAICRRLRGAGDLVPIVMLTAKGDEVDRIVGLEMGADDYLPKPFNPRELLARIQAVLRRRAPEPVPGAPSEQPAVIAFGPYKLDLATRLLTKDGATVALTTGEFALLKVLASNPRTPLSREKLLDLARGREHEPFDRSVDIQVSRLRRIIETDSTHPRYIQTVWGFGYVFVPEGEPR